MSSLPERNTQCQGDCEVETLTQVRLPKPHVDWQSVGFTPFQVNGHVQCTFTTNTGAWSEPRWVRDPYLSVHGLSPALNYAQQAFEGLRVFRAESGRIQLFRLASHAARFARSTAVVDIPAVPRDLFARAVRLAVALNSEFVPPFDGGCSMYIRPLAFAGSPKMNLQPSEEYTFCVFVTPVARLYGPVGLRALVVEGFDRTPPRGAGDVKVGGNYGPTIPIMRRARQEGYSLTLHLDSLTHSFVHEFSASGFVGVRPPSETGGVPTVVIPEDKSILPSITVDSTAEIARDLGWNVERRAIPFSELAEFSEVYTVGTASSLVPVSTIVRESTGERFEYTVDPTSTKSAYARLLDRLEGIKRGLYPEPWGWVEELDASKLLNEMAAMTDTGAPGKANGHANGHVNDKVNGKLNGYANGCVNGIGQGAMEVKVQEV